MGSGETGCGVGAGGGGLGRSTEASSEKLAEEKAVAAVRSKPYCVDSAGSEPDLELGKGIADFCPDLDGMGTGVEVTEEELRGNDCAIGDWDCGVRGGGRTLGLSSLSASQSMKPSSDIDILF